MIETTWNGYVVLADSNDTSLFSVYDKNGDQIENLSWGEVAEIQEVLEKERCNVV